MLYIGIDLGTSAVKLLLMDGAGQIKKIVSKEYPIYFPHPGWSEQKPEDWFAGTMDGLKELLDGCDKEQVAGISFGGQMHGLVILDEEDRVIRPALLWNDGRTWEECDYLNNVIGKEKLSEYTANISFTGFTAPKLLWVKENEPEVYERIYKVMLPGDYIAMRLTGEICTTISGLSEGMFWDFKENKVADFLLGYYGIDASLLADIRPTFSEQGKVTEKVAAELGLKAGTPVTYRAGDQPNNALSLNVFNPGEIASTAGTSGVVYGVNGSVNYDPKSRVNTFAHVNHTASQTRLGVLLCINGTGILNSWMKRTLASDLSYAEMNEVAAQAPIGAAGISILPFGNGAERMLQNQETGCSIQGVNFNLHNRSHLLRAAQEGIVFSFRYGIDIMKGMGMDVRKIHAGHANMFLSPLFRDTLAGVTGATIELYDTDGSVGAAKGAGMGAGIYRDNVEAFATLDKLAVIEPKAADETAYADAYARWKECLEKSTNN